MTTAAILTSPGRGAVASVAVWGQRAADVVGELFLPAAGGSLVDAALGRILFGQWHASGEDVVVCRRTGDEIEIHCHGGQAALQAILASLAERGCQQAAWPQWLERQAVRPLAVEALEALAKATTLGSAGILLDQLHGALEHELESCVAQIGSPNQDDWHEATARLRRLLDRYRLGRHLTVPFQVVIAGKPNVGKSSLINALAGYERSIVFNLPGTTRDVVTLRTAVGGWPVEVSDTAGLRGGGDALEAAGVRLARERMTVADVILLVFDASQAWGPDDDELTAQWPNALVIHNKVDLAEPSPDAKPGLVSSAQTGQGIEKLLEMMASRLVPEPPPAGAPMPFTVLQEQAIVETMHWLDRGDRMSAARRLRTLMGGWPS